MPPVTAPIVMSPSPSVALVSIVTLLPSVTAPKVIASLELLIVEASVTVPLVVSVNPPLKVKVSEELLPKVSVPSLANVDAALKVLVEPVKLILATVLSALSAAAATLALKVAVPPTSAKVRLPKLLIAPLAVMSAPATLSPVDKVKLFEPPVIAATVMSAPLSVALVSTVVALPSVTAPSTIASLDDAMVPFNVTVPPTDVVVSPPL